MPDDPHADAERTTGNRYEAMFDGEDSTLRSWSVIEPATERVVGGPFVRYTQAEAAIIAFALNAVAQGWDLYAEDNRTGASSEAIRGYDGPTEGVAS